MAKNKPVMRTVSMDIDDWEKINKLRGAMKVKDLMHLIANTLQIEYTKNGSAILTTHLQVLDISEWLGMNFPELNEEGLNRKEQELIEDGTIQQIDNHWIIRGDK